MCCIFGTEASPTPTLARIDCVHLHPESQAVHVSDMPIPMVSWVMFNSRDLIVMDERL